ncbi:MAG: TolC family outer membrane protein [Burkholderiales bacterium]
MRKLHRIQQRTLCYAVATLSVISIGWVNAADDSVPALADLSEQSGASTSSQTTASEAVAASSGEIEPTSTQDDPPPVNDPPVTDPEKPAAPEEAGLDNPAPPQSLPIPTDAQGGTDASPPRIADTPDRLALEPDVKAETPPRRKESLLQLYQEARERDAQYRSAQAAYLAGVEKLPQGRALLLPSVALTANTGFNRVQNDFESGFFPGQKTRFNAYSYTLSLTQPLFRVQNVAQFLRSRSEATQAETRFAIAQQDLVLRVAQSYFDVLFAEDSLAFAVAQKTSIAEQLEQAKRNFEVGTATITDTHEAQARFDLATADEIAAQNDLEIKRRAMQRIIGRGTTALAGLGAGFTPHLPEPSDMEQWVDRSLQQNLQVKTEEAVFEAARHEVTRTRADNLPTVDIVASYEESNSNDSAFGTGGNNQETGSVGLEFNLPLFEGGAAFSRVREALANRDKAQDDLENARRSVTLDTRQSYLNVTNGVSRIRALEAALASSQSSLESTKLSFEVGVRTFIDVLDAQRQLYSAKRDLSRARYDYILDRLRLQEAAGTLGEEHVLQTDSWLEGR